MSSGTNSPECGHSACRQHYIDSGASACVAPPAPCGHPDCAPDYARHGCGLIPLLPDWFGQMAERLELMVAGAEFEARALGLEGLDAWLALPEPAAFVLASFPDDPGQCARLLATLNALLALSGVLLGKADPLTLVRALRAWRDGHGVTWHCPECWGTNVDDQLWVDVNTYEVTGSCESYFYCNDCQEELRQFCGVIGDRCTQCERPASECEQEAAATQAAKSEEEGR